MADRFEDLRTFLTVLSCGGINAAAAELGIAKSAVSRRISDLEKRLDTSLIERSTRHFEPTARGLDYAKRARTILADLDDLDRSLTPSHDGSVITISSTVPLVRHVLVPAVANLPSGSMPSAIRFVLEQRDKLPAHINIGDEDQRSQASRPLFASSLVICTAPGYIKERGIPADAKDLERHVSIVTSVDRRPEWCFKAGPRSAPTAAMIVEDLDAAAAAALLGIGLVQVPMYVVAEPLRDGRLVSVLDEFAPSATTIRAYYAHDADQATLRMVDELASALG